MDGNKKTYPKGIYANRYPETPKFVRSNLKIDNAKAIAFLQANPNPYTFLQILESRTPDDYGNLDYICVDDYATEKELRKAKEGLAQAKQVMEQPSKPVEEDDLPLPTFGTSNEDSDDIPF